MCLCVFVNVRHKKKGRKRKKRERETNDFGSRMLELELLKDGGAVVGDGDVARGGRDHLVHAAGTQRRAQRVGNRTARHNVRLADVLLRRLVLLQIASRPARSAHRRRGRSCCPCTCCCRTCAHHCFEIKKKVRREKKRKEKKEQTISQSVKQHTMKKKKGN